MGPSFPLRLKETLYLCYSRVSTRLHSAFFHGAYYERIKVNTCCVLLQLLFQLFHSILCCEANAYSHLNNDIYLLGCMSWSRPFLLIRSCHRKIQQQQVRRLLFDQNQQTLDLNTFYLCFLMIFRVFSKLPQCYQCFIFNHFYYFFSFHK